MFSMFLLHSLTCVIKQYNDHYCCFARNSSRQLGPEGSRELQLLLLWSFRLSTVVLSGKDLRYLHFPRSLGAGAVTGSTSLCEIGMSSGKSDKQPERCFEEEEQIYFVGFCILLLFFCTCVSLSCFQVPNLVFLSLNLHRSRIRGKMYKIFSSCKGTLHQYIHSPRFGCIFRYDISPIKWLVPCNTAVPSPDEAY